MVSINSHIQLSLPHVVCIGVLVFLYVYVEMCLCQTKYWLLTAKHFQNVVWIHEGIMPTSSCGEMEMLRSQYLTGIQTKWTMLIHKHDETVASQHPFCDLSLTVTEIEQYQFHCLVPMKVWNNRAMVLI